MAKIKTIEPLVEKALKYEPRARSDDYILILKVLSEFVTPEMSLEAVFINHVQLGIPSLESITRSRRKIQEQNPNLRDEKAVKIRHNEEIEYRKYARGE